MQSKNLILAIVLSLGVVFAYQAWLAPPPGPVTPPVQPQPQPQEQPPEPPPEGPGAGDPAAPVPAPPAHEAVSVRLSEGPLDFEIGSAGGGTIVSGGCWACGYHERDGEEHEGDPGHVTEHVRGRPGTLAADVVGEAPDVSVADWALTPTPRRVEAQIRDGGLELRKSIETVRDAAHPYHVEVAVEVANPDGAAAGSARRLVVHGPLLSPSEDPHALPTFVLAPVGDDSEDVELPDLFEEFEERPNREWNAERGWRWLAARRGFYVSALVPREPLPAGTTVLFTDLRRADGTRAAGSAFSIPFDVPAAGESLRFQFRFYAGPASRPVITGEGSPYNDLEDALPSGGFLNISFRPLTALLGWLLEVLAKTFGLGYGLAVIALTVIVRGALFPLSKKSQLSMRLHAQRMARLKPKMDAIKEKHKDPRKQQELTMKLMREEKVSLLPGGCLLAFLQMPIWIALFGVLQTTYEMRHAGFLWFDDLTQPDRLLRLSFLDGVWMMPEWLNLLPLLMMVTWYLSARMQPMPADPQQAQQAKMMRWIPMLFGVMLYNYAAGLALYMTMSAVWSIGESWLIRKVWLSKLEPAPAAVPARA